MRKGWFAAAFAALAIAAYTRMPHKPSTQALFRDRPEPTSCYYRGGGRIVHAVKTGTSSGPSVLFIHGTPGAWDDFAGVMTDTGLCARAHLVSIDRPGWGDSPGAIETSLARQSEILAGMLDMNPQSLPVIVVGHSLGGPIAARLAMDRPDAVRALILVSPSIDPALERTAWYVRASRSPAIRWAVPRALIAADDEIKPLRADLAAMLPGWANLHMPVTVIQGDRDKLVDPANADFAARMLTSVTATVVRVPGQGHLIHWERPDLIRDAILNALPDEP